MTGSDQNPDGAQVGAGLAEAVLEQVALSRSEVVGNAPQFVSGSLTLSAPAPAGGREIELFSDRPDVLSLPSSVTVPEGDKTAAFDAAFTQVAQRVVALITARHKEGDVARWTPLLIHAPGDAPDSAVEHAAAPETAEVVSPTSDSVNRNGAVAPSETLMGPTTVEVAAATSQTVVTSPFAELATKTAAALDPAWKPETLQSFRAALLAIVPVVPFIAVLAMVAIYAAPQRTLLSQFDPFLAGTGFALVLGLVCALIRWRVVQDTSAERADSTSYDQIRERLSGVTARLSSAAEHVDDDEGRQIAIREVQGWRAQVLTELSDSGPGWVMGTSYLNVWKLIHRAEEALLELQPVAQVVAEAVYDEQRLSGSQVDDRDQLLTRLRLAVGRLDTNSMVYLNQQPVPPASTSAAGGPDPATFQAARSVLREIRRTINEFRDTSWGGIVRARNQLLRSLTLTGLVTYFGLMLAIDLTAKPADNQPQSDPIIAAAVFYLVGALVGLFNRLSSEANGVGDVEDYGLTEARLALTPVLSGLAAVGGVYLTAMLTGTLNGVVSASVPASAAALPHTADIMNLSQNPFGVVLAAIFGLSPTMLISSLQAQADKFKGALQSTTAHTS